MWTVGTAQQIGVSLARHEAHGPPWQTAPQRPVSQPATLTPPGQSANPSRAASPPHAVSATPSSQPELLDRLREPLQGALCKGEGLPSDGAAWGGVWPSSRAT
jgi:hypothetical protein